MANTVKLKRSAVTGRVPTTSDLALGELALNTFDGDLFFKKDASGTESILTVATLTGTQTLTNKTLVSPSVTTQLSLNDRASLRFYDSNSSNYVALRSASTVTTDVTWTLPIADGIPGQFIQTDGAGNLTFAAASGDSATGFFVSTMSTLPGANDDYDLAKNTDQTTSPETPFESGNVDSFAVSLGLVYDMMEPRGRYATTDLADTESYVNA